MNGHIILSHGSNSSPESTKVSALARLAEGMGFTTERPDFGDCDVHGHAESVTPRLGRLERRMQAATEPVILVGSSMGAFVSGLASLRVPCRAIFLLALPTAIPGFAQPFDMQRGIPSMLIHGFQDDVCPADAALDFAGERRVPTLLLPDGHRLAEHVDVIGAQFRLFLEGVRA